MTEVIKQTKTYVLVHGAWHGSWCWHKVADHLRQVGHKVITPDLPGHLSNKQDFNIITLNSYVNHIENILNESPQPVVLVGHSMGGIVISQVAENIPDKIDHLIYISAFIPQNGGSLFDEAAQAIVPSRVSFEIQIDEAEASISFKSQRRIQGLFYGNCRDEDADYALSLVQKQPLQPFSDKTSISDTRFGSVSKLYIECLQDKAIMIQDQRRMYSRINCDVETLDTDHSPFFSADRQLAEIIVGYGDKFYEN